jgi:hypothetical protein
MIRLGNILRVTRREPARNQGPGATKAAVANELHRIQF